MKKEIFHIFVTSGYQSSISQNLKVVGLLGEKFDSFVSMGIQIEVDFHPHKHKN